MAYYECLNNNDHINIGDKYIVTLSGSHNKVISATVCYIYYGDDISLCLLGDTSLGTGDWYTQRTLSWNYTVNINNKEYTGICRIPTHEQIYSKCAGYPRDFTYWTSTGQTNSLKIVDTNKYVYATGTNYTCDITPFIEITL